MQRGTGLVGTNTLGSCTQQSFQVDNSHWSVCMSDIDELIELSAELCKADPQSGQLPDAGLQVADDDPTIDKS